MNPPPALRSHFVAALRSCIRRRAFLICAVAVVVFAANSAGAQTFTWQPTTGGLYNAVANWSAGGPPNASGELSLFAGTTSQTVTFQTNVTVSNHIIRSGNYTFQLDDTTQTMTAANGLIVGDTAGTTGSLTLLNGTLTGDLALGSVADSIGVLTIGSDAVFDAASNPVTVGAATNSGGALAILNGGRFTTTSSVTIGNNPNSNGSILVSGQGSSLATGSGAFVVGANGTADVVVSNRGTISTTTVSIGDAPSTSGSLLVTGAGSSFTASAIFTVGNQGAGEFRIEDGAIALASNGARIAGISGSTGTVTVTGTGSTWTVSSLAIGGIPGNNGGNGKLSITAAGTVNVSGNAEIRSSAGSSLTIDGGTMNVAGSFTRLGTLNLIDGKLHVTGLFDNGVSNTVLSIDGSTPTALPILQLSGASGTLSHVTTINVGVVNQGGLIVDNGRLISLGANSLLIGTTATGLGSVLVTGSNSAINTTNVISIGGNTVAAQGTGELTISNNAAVSTATLNVFPQGTLTIDNGTLNVTTLNFSGGSTVNFQKGRINFTAASTDLTASLLDSLLSTTHELGVGRTIGGGASTLTLQTPLTINGGTLSSGSGGPLANSSTLVLNSGTVNSDATFTNNAGAIFTIGGTSTVTAGSIFNQGTIVLDHNLTSTGATNLTNSGVIRGSGMMTNTMTNTVSGQIQVTTGNRIQFTTSSFSSAGIISVNGGELVFNSNFGNASSGLLSGRDGVIRGGTTGIANGGSIAFSGGFMDVYGDVSQNAGGRITITGGGVTTFYDDVTISPGANNIQVSASAGVVSSVVFLGSYNGGTTGGGAAFIEGDHRPGNSPATVSFGGDTFYGSASHLKVELGGTTPGTQYDQVHVAGLLSLSGALNVSLINGFIPSLGNTFDILDWGSKTGAFASVSLPGLNGGLAWNLAQLYTAGTLSVVSSNLLPGDFNRDAQITAADIPAMLKALTNLTNYAATNFLTPAQLVTLGDLDGSGTITNADIQGLLSLVVTLGGGSVAAVPEPSTIVLVLAAIVGISPFVRMRRPKRFDQTRT
jgi:fibronectin-binding autotransporter adhesin